MLVTYADNRTEEIPASKLTFGELTFNAPTSQSNPTQIEVTYHNQTFGIPVTVLTNEVVSIELISGLETTIEQGDTLNTSNFVVLVTYADERTEEVNSAQLQIGAFDSSTPTSAGDPRSLAVTYKNKTDYIGIVVLTTQITSMEVKAGSIETTIYVKDVLDTSNLVVIFTFADSRTQEVSASNLQVGTISTSTEGTKQLSVTYKNQTFYIDIVVESQVFVTSMRSQLLIDFDNARSTQTNKQIEFYDQNQPLYVGADNPFNFRITVTAIQDGNFASGAHLAKTNIQVKLYDGENYNLLTGETLESYVAINNSEKSFDFTENAIGKKFEITITATNIDTEYDVQDTSFTAEVEVVEGYNVYNAIELSVFDNKNTNGVWTNLKAEHNLTNVTTNAIILQNNIDLTKEDLAPAYFWTTETPGYSERLQYTDLTLEGSMIDNREIGIYERDLNDGDTFNFIGNYFSIDASALPKAVAEDVSDATKVINYANNQGITAHTCLFQTDIKDDVTITTADTQINYKNIYFIGNGALSNDVRNSGALLMMKSYNVNFNSYNTITHNFYIGYMFGSGERDNEFDGEYVIEKVKSYNSYQTQIYCWGAEHTVIKDSEIIGAGGPAIIADHYGYEKSGNNFTDIGHYSTVDIINSTIESKVSGTEPWFETYEGSSALAGQMLLLEQFFDGSAGLPALNKTIVADSVGTPAVQRMNAVVLMKSGSAEGLTSDRLMGYTRMFKSQNDYDKYYAQGEYAGQTPDTTVTYGLDMMAGTTDANALVNKAMSNNAVYIQSNGNGGYINQGFGSANTDSSMLSGVNYDQGDYLNLYLYNGMGLILQLYDTTRE